MPKLLGISGTYAWLEDWIQVARVSALRLQALSPTSSARSSRTDLEAVGSSRLPTARPQPRNDSFEAAPRKVLAALRRCATCAEVRGLQAKLQLLGMMSAGDVKSGPGVYGPRTELAVERFQERVGLPVTGIADATTRVKIMSVDRRDLEATAPVVNTLELSRMAQTLTDEDEDDTVGLGRAS